MSLSKPSRKDLTQNDFAAGHLLAPFQLPSLPLLRDSNLENLDADPVPYPIDFEAALNLPHESGTEKISRIKNTNKIVLWESWYNTVVGEERYVGKVISSQEYVDDS